MNANELADALDVESSKAEYGYVADDWKLFSDSAKMLRQQQVEIEALNQRNWDLVSEPWGFDRKPAKTLTDEEITAIWESCDLCGGLGDAIDFARAILRKAQEK